mmetsp:Transcript_10782/g.26153  ORF Transcript_10782/g.26153 Transcript_10782/m.26153 type:complete len:290 (-) Transcript_10782:345-1214(-)
MTSRSCLRDNSSRLPRFFAASASRPAWSSSGRPILISSRLWITNMVLSARIAPAAATPTPAILAGRVLSRRCCDVSVLVLRFILTTTASCLQLCGSNSRLSTSCCRAPESLHPAVSTHSPSCPGAMPHGAHTVPRIKAGDVFFPISSCSLWSKEQKIWKTDRDSDAPSPARPPSPFPWTLSPKLLSGIPCATCTMRRMRQRSTRRLIPLPEMATFFPSTDASSGISSKDGGSLPGRLALRNAFASGSHFLSFLSPDHPMAYRSSSRTSEFGCFFLASGPHTFFCMCSKV